MIILSRYQTQPTKPIVPIVLSNPKLLIYLLTPPPSIHLLTSANSPSFKSTAPLQTQPLSILNPLSSLPSIQHQSPLSHFPASTQKVNDTRQALPPPTTSIRRPSHPHSKSPRRQTSASELHFPNSIPRTRTTVLQINVERLGR
jgi:hypothetical protein